LTEAALSALSIEKHVTSNFPPTFLFHCHDDMGLSPEHSLALYQALLKAGVPAEFHVFGQGGHGVGFSFGDPASSTWPGLLGNWLRHRGLMTGDQRVSVKARVLIDGETMQGCWITFIPRDSSKPTAAAYTLRGCEMVIPAERGPCPGPHWIEVRQIGFGLNPEPTIDDLHLYTKESPASRC